MKSRPIAAALVFLVAIVFAGCFEVESHNKGSQYHLDLSVAGGSDDPEGAMEGYCEAMGQRDYETASLMIWSGEWYDEGENLEYQRKIFVDSLYKQGWRADDRDFSKYQIIEKTPIGKGKMNMMVSIGSRKGYYSEYPYAVIEKNDRWYVYLESTSATFGINF